ncbi:MAG: LemA family protein, partial [Planctomycetes bacterium]|nr:LemA family protein [Planctomycetota bacterium]
PDLKANQNFLMLQEELAGTEGKIAYARQFYNDSVMTFNMTIQRVPSNLVAGTFGFKERDYFEIEEPEARAPVAVSFTRSESQASGES